MKAGLGFAALAAGLLLAGGADAAWRVVGPGLAVGDARAGSAELGVECHEHQLLLAVFNLSWDSMDNDALKLVVDGKAFPVFLLGFPDHLAFFDEITDGKRGLSAPLLASLTTGNEVTFEGWIVRDIEPRDITFGLLGSEAAIATVRKFCE